MSSQFHPPASKAEADPRRWVALAVLLIASFMNLIDVTIVNVAIPSMQANLGADASQIEWVIAAYVLAGELHKARGDASAALAGYESVLRDFIGQKQRAAGKFAGSFAPRTELGLFLRNKISGILALPHVAEWVFGNAVTDHLTLPDYGD